MGPTASGKSALGMYLAQELDGVIINADTMQCYADLQIITARPHEKDLKRVPHKLYGIWPAVVHGNAAMWQEAAVEAIKDAHRNFKLPILLGGTGMYIKALMEGLAPVPKIDPALHERMKVEWTADPAKFYERLKLVDPKMAARLKPGDQQRQIRAMEVIEQTGISLADWQEKPVNPTFAKEQFVAGYMNMPREDLYRRIDDRFDSMIAAGALDEMRLLVQTLRRTFPDVDPAELAPSTVAGDGESEERKKYNTLPVLRAHGVPELIAYLCGKLSMEEAIDRAKLNTRHYAKRQMTWLRNQMPHALPISHDLLQDAEKSEAFIKRLAKTIDRPAVTY